jgi:hypothetical protein
MRNQYYWSKGQVPQKAIDRGSNGDVQTAIRLAVRFSGEPHPSVMLSYGKSRGHHGVFSALKKPLRVGFFALSLILQTQATSGAYTVFVIPPSRSINAPWRRRFCGANMNAAKLAISSGSPIRTIFARRTISRSAASIFPPVS